MTICTLLKPIFARPLPRRALLLGVASVLGIGLSLGSQSSCAQPYPSKPIKLIIPFNAGGALDIVGRLLAGELSKQLNQSVIVENKAGAGGNIAASFVAKSEADGYTLLMGSTGNSVNKALYGNLNYDPDTDLTPVAIVGQMPNVLLAHKSVPANTVSELIALSKTNPASLNFASGGSGTSEHLAAALFNLKAGTTISHIPYKGGAPANQDLIGGQVDIFLAPFGKAYDELHKQGKIKILAMLNSERLESVKAYPAISESKTLKNFTFNIWTGYFVKKDTPETIVQVLHKTITDSLSDAAVRSGLEANSQLVAKPLSLQAVDKAYVDGTAQFRAIAKSINLQPQ